ncbi:hypothetical protein GJ633_00355 [Halorubrum sp. CBA1125]|uniref:PD-(D/E)XK nuclease family protein n=1 Tax=Halorubrum sp. CBA1125 TaxID=2668072 RepID=UPI0012E81EF6|nr:PD-(D/E)XK nuclease family protein [Halorubrum sp. CBA1125]MUW13268.1 hypothetical protein [Halorubrum sp. CBA1125]
MQQDSGRDLSEMFSLLQEVQGTGTNIFEILDIEDHEKRLTCFLAWLLNTNGSHNAGPAFLDAFLDCFDLQASAPVDVRYLEVLNSTEHGQVEIDLVIETDSRVIGVEIKTTHTESQTKFKKEAAVLREYAQEHQQKAAEMLYLPHLGSEVESAHYAEHIATWHQVVEALQTCRGELESGHDIALFDDFITDIDKHVIRQEVSFSKESELYLKYRDYLEDFEIDINADSYQNDRKDIYNHLWQWFEENYETDRWNGQFDRSRKFGKNTRYIRLYKNGWHLTEGSSGRPAFTLEIQGTEKRLSWYSDNEGADAYRLPEPHFEMTVALNDNTESQKRREAYREYLGEAEREALCDGGFQSVRERLNEVDSAAPYNKYHMYSKIIPIDFTDPDNVVEELKTGLQTFVALEESIDEFTRDLPSSH